MERLRAEEEDDEEGEEDEEEDDEDEEEDDEEGEEDDEDEEDIEFDRREFRDLDRPRTWKSRSGDASDIATAFSDLF